jgi:hypothetical protein
MVGRLVCSIKWINVVKGFKTASCTGYKALTLLAKKGNGGDVNTLRCLILLAAKLSDTGARVPFAPQPPSLLGP